MKNDNIVFAKIKTLEDLEGEIWRPIRNSNHYFISNLGRVKSNNKHPMKILEQKKNQCGYWRVCLSLVLGEARYYLVSRIVCETFNPEEADENKEVHHLNGKDDNRAESLVWLSKKEHTQEHERMKGNRKSRENGKE